MPPRPLAFHITFGTYGTRLHGDERGTVHRGMNKPGEPILGGDDQWLQVESSLLKFDPVRLLDVQRAVAEAAIPNICKRGGWRYHVAAARPDHVHVLLSATTDSKAVRRWFKRWLGESLSQRWKLPDGATWWAECGSIKWVWTQEYFDHVFEYIRRQRLMPGSQTPAPSRTL